MSLLIEIFTNPITLIVFCLYGGLMFWEHIAPGRDLPAVKGWRFKGVACFLVYVVLSTAVPLWWDPLLAPYQLLDLTFLGTWGGTIAGLLAYELLAWMYHRALHSFGPLWRIHQTHHSAVRLDVAGAFVFHPLDMLGWTAVGSLALVVGVGVTPEAATNILLILNLLAIFQHSNVSSPRWLGFLVQRPESHTVHHAQSAHGCNYADLPLIDLIFGTFENPAGYEYETGIFPGASSKHWALLSLQDVGRDQPQFTKTTASDMSREGLLDR